MSISQLEENIHDLLQRVDPKDPPAPVQTPATPPVPADVPLPAAAPLPAPEPAAPLPAPGEGEDGLSQPPAHKGEEQKELAHVKEQEQQHADTEEKPPEKRVEDGIPGKCYNESDLYVSYGDS